MKLLNRSSRAKTQQLSVFFPSLVNGSTLRCDGQTPSISIDIHRSGPGSLEDLERTLLHRNRVDIFRRPPGEDVEVVE